MAPQNKRLKFTVNSAHPTENQFHLKKKSENI